MNCDEIGPEFTLSVYDPKTKMTGFIVIDSTVRGPGKGGIRMSPTVDKEEVLGLARAMTLKTALADLPYGGGKSGIIADPKKLSADEKKIIVKAFAKKLAAVAPKFYVAAPDIAMAEDEMRWIAEEIGGEAVTGKPANIGGIPHELGSTGWGVYVAAREILKHKSETLQGKKVSVQGFGNVGTFAAKFMVDEGAILVAASDSTATLYSAEGMDVNDLIQWKESKKSFSEYLGYHRLSSDASLFVDCDILVPSAQKHVITEQNQVQVKAKLIVQGANLPLTDAAELMLEKRGMLNLPDILANAGGVISSAVEDRGGSAEEVFPLIEGIITKNIQLLKSNILDPEKSSREGCITLAKQRILEHF